MGLLLLGLLILWLSLPDWLAFLIGIALLWYLKTH
jgi:hypothetical protein